ncbi:outer membrane lipoprotein-sorting protein [Thioalkalivibrio sp. XN279]|uniref:outer membrane lipoprotein-sorting protein n=1 Tax=Thioalkalivibrio sp. XN279 TaxID=2714953 RepID=UPI00140AA8DD|nr:outer membrane lipoprotein-sorting protein [Thioalkalivibrio sp. XN279]NHA14992.1 outer membrane lipoprotein-sorting protein [Thioalkalivibrio sp. XN279]
MKTRLLTSITLLALALGNSAAAEPLTDVDEIVARANLAAYYGGDDGRSEARMAIEDNQGRKQLRQFTILRRDHADGGDQDFMVFFSRPSDVRGTVFLVAKHVDRDDDRWLYLPGLDLVRRISAGDKRTSFVGSHFFYEDVSGRNPAEDEHRLVETTAEHYVLESTPKDPASVEFTRYVTRIDRQTFLPMKTEYYDSRDRVYRLMEVLDVEEIGGYPTVTRSRMSEPLDGGSTLMEFRYTEYDVGLPADIFSERYLRTPPTDWLRRGGE